MRRSILCLIAAAGLAGCAYDDGYGPYGYDEPGYRYGDYRYDGRAYGYGDRDRVPRYFTGAGARLLDPWLSDTSEGREIVSLGFTEARDGRISERTAHRANIWFRRHADVNRDMALTDEEIRIALANAASSRAWERDGY